MSDHVTDRAGFLAALSLADPERAKAEAHARDCAPCREALEEGTRLKSLLKRAIGVLEEAPSARPFLVDRAPARLPAVARRWSWPIAGAVVLAWLFQITVGGGFRLDHASALASLAVLALAIASVTVLQGYERWAVAIVVATSGIFAYASGSVAGFEPGVGIRCMFRELWAAALAWDIVLVLGRRSGIVFDSSKMMAVAAAGALAAHAGQHLACSVPHSDLHLLVFHFGGVLLAIVLGARLAPTPIVS
jgi:hypothetical protein